LNALQFTNTPNTGVAFIPLCRSPSAMAAPPADQCRDQPEDRRPAGRLRVRDDAAADPRPGQRQRLPDVHRGPRQPGYGALQNAVQAMQGTVAQTPGMAFPISSYQANVPQLDAEVDRVKAKAQGVQLTELFDTCRPTSVRPTSTTSTSSAVPGR
jgi:multidrug efflux pump